MKNMTQSQTGRIKKAYEITTQTANIDTGRSLNKLNLRPQNYIT
jgi:hypothetical protein